MRDVLALTSRFTKCFGMTSGVALSFASFRSNELAVGDKSEAAVALGVEETALANKDAQHLAFESPPHFLS